ncbi:MAG: hypothetical protein HY855_17005 [Burkholderiales bacterium]|nr:hypothetical protein [Burkholderiales bacterium]
MTPNRFFQWSATAMLVATTCGALLVSGPATAGIVYSNGGPDFSGALVSDAVLPTQSTLGVGQQGAELLRTPATAANPNHNFHIVDRLRFWGGYVGGPLPQADDFTFYLSSSSNIDHTIFIKHFAAGEVQRSSAPVGHWTHVDALGQSQQIGIYAYEVALAAFALPLDHESYASVVNNTSGESANWAWALSGAGDGNSLWRNHPGWWTDRQTDFAFELLGPVAGPMPVSEPAGIWFAALAALAVAGCRVRRRAA